MKKPANIIYWLNDRPPGFVLVSSSLQQAAVVLVFLFPAILVARAVGADAPQTAGIISLALVASAFGTALQAWGRWGLGVGFLAPVVPATAFVAPGLLAAETGGLALVAGMTICSGFALMALSRGLHRLRALIPTEIAGAVVFIVGLSVALGGARTFLRTADGGPPLAGDAAAAAITLAVAIGLSIWGRGVLRYTCVLIAMLCGTLAAIPLGALRIDEGFHTAALPLLGLPALSHAGFAFDAALLPAFLVASLASALKTVGVVTQLQKLNDADWVRPDPRGPAAGIAADGAATLLAGLLGTPPQNTSSTNATIQQATGVTSRVVGLATAGLCLLLALFPRATALLAQVPVPVIAATLVYAGGLMLVNGMQLAASRLLDMRKTVAVGLGVVTALTIETAPQIAGWAPAGLRPLLTSTALGTIVAIALNALLRIGVRQQVGIVIPARETGGVALWDFVMSAGASWGARADVVTRVATAIAWCGDALAAADLARSDLTVTIGFDEHRIDVRITYEGPPIVLSPTAPSALELLEDETAPARLAGHMVARLAERLSVRERSGTTELRFALDH